VRYALQRLGQFILVFLVVTFLVMVITRVGSKDPARDLAGGLVAQEQVDEVRELYRLDEPFIVQYGHWLKNLVTLDFGYSYAQNQSVNDMMKQRLLPSLFIGLWAMFIGLLLAVPAAIYSAYRRDGLFDRAMSTTSFAFLSMPPIVIAVLLSFFIGVKLGWFPVDSNYVALWDSPWGHFKNFILPSFTLGLGLSAVWARLLRADLINTLQSDFIMLARAKGMSPRRILWVHALRASALSLITSIAIQMGGLIGGAVVAEQFFAMPGIGDRLVFAIQQNDLLVVQAITALLAIVVVAVNLLVDLFYAVIDPRIRHARATR